jgi:hypothetical protein
MYKPYKLSIIYTVLSNSRVYVLKSLILCELLCILKLYYLRITYE